MSFRTLLADAGLRLSSVRSVPASAQQNADVLFPFWVLWGWNKKAAATSRQPRCAMLKDPRGRSAVALCGIWFTHATSGGNKNGVRWEWRKNKSLHVWEALTLCSPMEPARNAGEVRPNVPAFWSLETKLWSIACSLSSKSHPTLCGPAAPTRPFDCCGVAGLTSLSLTRISLIRVRRVLAHGRFSRMHLPFGWR